MKGSTSNEPRRIKKVKCEFLTSFSARTQTGRVCETGHISATTIAASEIWIPELSLHYAFIRPGYTYGNLMLSTSEGFTILG